MKTHDDLRWDFKQETELDSIYRQNNNIKPFNEAYVKWLEDKILLANDAEQSDSNCNIPLVSGCCLNELKEVYNDIVDRNANALPTLSTRGWGGNEILKFFEVLIKTLDNKR